MDIALTEDQQLIASTAIEFAKGALTAAQIRALEDSEHGFDRAVWRQMVDLGWAGAPFAERYGGSELGPLELSLIVTGLAQSAIPSPLFSTVIEAGMLIAEAGSEAQCENWLPRIAAGKGLLTVAVAEPGRWHADAQAATRLEKTASGWRISGTKTFVRDAGVADALVCLATADAGPTFVLVGADAAGVERRRLVAAGGEALWEVTFKDVAVDFDAIVGAPGGAAPHLKALRLRGAAMKAAELVGIGQAALDLTLEYAKTRVQFGRPIGAQQAVHHHCVEMYRDLQVSRLLAWQAAARLGSGKPAEREVAMAKAKASEAIPALTRTAHQIHGAVGYYRDYPLELYYHRAIAAQATYGDAADQRRTLGRLMVDSMDRFRGDHAHGLPVHQD